MKSYNLNKEMRFDLSQVNGLEIINESAEIDIVGVEDAEAIDIEFSFDEDDSNIRIESGVLKIDAEAGRLNIKVPEDIKIDLSTESGRVFLKSLKSAGSIVSASGPVRIETLKGGSWSFSLENAPLVGSIVNSIENLSIVSENGPIKLIFKGIDRGNYSISTENAPVRILLDRDNDISISVESENKRFVDRIRIPLSDGRFVLGKGTAALSITTEFGPIKIDTDEGITGEARARSDFREEKLRILRMVEAGTISVDEGMKLLNAIGEKEKRSSEGSFGSPKAISVSYFNKENPNDPEWQFSVPIKIFQGQRSFASFLGLGFGTKQSRYSKRRSITDIDLSDIIPTKMFGTFNSNGLSFEDIEDRFSTGGDFILASVESETDKIVVEIKGDV
jgi:hypothetical protein